MKNPVYYQTGFENYINSCRLSYDVVSIPLWIKTSNSLTRILKKILSYFSPAPYSFLYDLSIAYLRSNDQNGEYFF